MASSSCIALPADRKRVIGELTRGREIADKLLLMLRETDGVGGASGLVGKILDSFTESISIICGGGESDEVSQVPPAVFQKSEDSGDSCKTPAPKDRRGCYKRRRSSETTIKETRNWLEDGHAWRKYGQKVILNAKHPRNYFRCSHKFDQGCQASKQVQKIQDDPPLFRTTYHGSHTCKNLFKSSIHDHIIMGAAAATGDSSILWNFQSQDCTTTTTNSLLINNSTTVPVKKETNEDYQIKSPSSPSDSDYFIPPFDDHTFRAFPSGSDLSSDVYSCTASTHSMEMEMNMNMNMNLNIMVPSVNISDFLEFDRLS